MDRRHNMGKTNREQRQEKKKQEKKKERWLLTRKTWRYMADAGRKLVPDGHNKPEDVPKIEAYFQEVCQKEPRFLLWRKQSYPGALGFRRRRNRKKGGSCRDKASSADEAETPPDRFAIRPAGQGRFDLQRMKREFLFGKEAQPQVEPPQENVFLDTLQQYLYQDKVLDHQELLEKLKQHLADIERTRAEEKRRAVQFEGDPSERSLLETIRRYFGKSTNREKVISDLLTDRKKLEKLYFELRQARSFMAGSRGTIGGRQTWTGTYHSQDNVYEQGFPLGQSQSVTSGLDRSYWQGYDTHRAFHGSRHLPYGEGTSYGGGYPRRFDYGEGSSRLGHSKSSGALSDRRTLSGLDEESSTPESNTPSSPPLIVEIEPDPTADFGTQTEALTDRSIFLLGEELKRIKLAEAKEEEELKSPPREPPRRASLVDNDDVSPSVGDTIKRYLRMARKKSTDSDKADRFKRVNYDRNLRNIKAKGEITKISDDDGNDKGAQTEDTWVEAFKNLKLEYEPGWASSRSSLTEDTLSPTSPTSKSFLSSGQSFLSSLLHGLQDKSGVSVTGGGMQKSKSSTSVVQQVQQGSRYVTKKIWKPRSKSQSRAVPSATSAWTPQGDCTWSNLAGRSIQLKETMLHQLSELERRLLQKVALAKLQALNLGVAVKLPSENPAPSSVQKPKRRAYLLKRKAVTTAFDASRKEENKEGGGMVFGVPLSQCVDGERARGLRPELDEPRELRRKAHHASRASFSSLIEVPNPQQGGSVESLSPTLSMPGLDSLSSCGSCQQLGEPTGGTGVPNIVSSCLRHLQDYGLNTLGIFRVSSSKKRVRQLREEFDSGKETELGEELCPHDVATLLKEYFRHLPDPLLCKDLYHAFVHTQRIRNRRLQQEAMQHLVQLLPVAHRDTLWALLNLLAKVAANSQDRKDENGEWVTGNKMDSSNLATMFAPNLLHPCSTAKEELSAERSEERADAINVIRTLIDNHKSLFLVGAELMDEVYVHMMDSHPEDLDILLSAKDPQQLDDESSQERKKVWAREDCLHERAGLVGQHKSWRLERSRERTSRRRKEEAGGRREARRSSEDRRPTVSSDSGRHTPEEIANSEGVITASLKIHVPSSASFSVNLEDIPYIEDTDKHHHHQERGGSESGLGSLSRGGSSSWDSGPTSPDSEPSQSRPHPTLQRVTIHHTSQIQQVQPTQAKVEPAPGRAETVIIREAKSDGRLSKSASSSAVMGPVPTEQLIPLAKEALAARCQVLRSKTADMERLRIRRGLNRPQATTTQEQEARRRVRHQEGDTEARTRPAVWKRTEIISSEAGHSRQSFY